ncbi:MAG: hypothetical protein ACKN9J_01090 [Holophagaceae bacterium]
MNTQRIHSQIIRSLNKYERILQNSSEEEFTRAPSPGAWSRSEVISHILGVHGWILERIENWSNKTYKQSKPQPVLVHLIFLLGTLGPKKIKAPELVRDQVVVMTRGEASVALKAFRLFLDKVTPIIDAIPSKRGWDHPYLGFLSAHQWFKLIEIHMRHHEKQL